MGDDMSMTLEQFTRAIAAGQMPDDLSPALRALWEDACGRWSGAHEVAQEIEDATGAWVHAYLHRKEGDAANARYWYRRAGKPEATDSLESEWRRIVTALL
jgi:hypothetical protein